MNSLISPDNVWMLWAVILSGVALSIWLEQKYQWASKVSGPVVAMVIAMLLSNTGIMPMDTTVHAKLDDSGKVVKNEAGEIQTISRDGVYEFIGGDLVPLALPLLLFRASFFQILKTTGPTFLAFHVAAVGTFLGAFLAAFALHRVPQSLIANNIIDMSAIMTGSYIGGAVNFAAIAENYKSPTEVTTSLLVADAFVMAMIFLVLLLIAKSRWGRRWYPHPHSIDSTDSRQLAAEHWKPKEISLLDIATALAVAVGVIAMSKISSAFVQSLITDDYKMVRELAGNKFIHITSWSVFVATLFHSRLSKINGAQELGSLLLYIFLFTIGLPSNFMEVIRSAPLMFLFCGIMAVTNLVFTLGVGKLLKLNLEDLLISVNATLGGPPSAAAMAVSCGWSKLVLPGILIGIWGYIIGTPLGITVHNILESWLGK